MYYIIENNIIDCDINIIYYSDDINQLNNFLINYMKNKKCELIESNKNITNELYNRSPGLYYQYKYKENNDENNSNNNQNNDDKSIVIYERLSSYIPFVNSYQLTNTLYIKKYIPPKISLFRYDTNNDLKNNQINSLFGQISNFNLNSLKNKENKIISSEEEEGKQKKINKEKTFIDELRDNILFNSRRSKMKLHNSHDDILYDNKYTEENKIPIIIHIEKSDGEIYNDDDDSYTSDWSD